MTGSSEKKMSAFLEKMLEMTQPFSTHPLQEKFLKIYEKQKKKNALWQTEWTPFTAKKEAVDRKLSDDILRKDQYKMVFIDGAYSEINSSLPDVVQVIDLKNPDKNFLPFIKNLFQKQLAHEEDLFALLNGFGFTSGILLFLPKGYVVEKPLHIHHHISEDVTQKGFIAPRIELFLHERAKVHLMQTYHGARKELFFLSQISIHLEKEAKVFCDYLLQTKTSHHMDLVRTFLKERAEIDFKGFVTECEEGYLNGKALLLDEKAVANFHGASLLSNDANHLCEIGVHHLAPNTISKQMFRGVIKDRAKLSFEGKIKIDPIAQKSDASQLSQNLLLSDDALVTTKPYLEIFADDVKATHGATLSKFNEEQVFYLQTRGLSSQESKKLLVEGFIREILELIKSPLIKKSVNHSLTPYL